MDLSGLLGNGPHEPNAGLREGAAAAFSMFRAYSDAGFTDEQALRLTTAVLVALVEGGMEGDGK